MSSLPEFKDFIRSKRRQQKIEKWNSEKNKEKIRKRYYALKKKLTQLPDKCEKKSYVIDMLLAKTKP